MVGWARSLLLSLCTQSRWLTAAQRLVGHGIEMIEVVVVVASTFIVLDVV